MQTWNTNYYCSLCQNSNDFVTRYAWLSRRLLLLSPSRSRAMSRRPPHLLQCLPRRLPHLLQCLPRRQQLLPPPRHRSIVCTKTFGSHTLRWCRWLINNPPRWWLARIPLRRILMCFTRPSRERWGLCNHLNLLYNHKHKWVNILIVSDDHFILMCFAWPSRELHSLCNLRLNLLYNHKHKWVNLSSRDHFLIDSYSFLGCSLWKASAKRLPGINSGVLHSVHHLQSHLHYHRHTCTVALNQGQWTNTNSLAGLFFNLLYYFSLVLANNYNYVNETNFDIQAHNEKGTGNYKKAKRFGNIAIYLTLVNIIYTLFIDTLIVGLAISLRCEFLHIMSNRHVVKHSINLF